MDYERLELLEDIFLAQEDGEETICFACNKLVDNVYQVVANVVSGEGKIETRFLMLCDRCYKLYMKEGG